MWGVGFVFAFFCVFAVVFVFFLGGGCMGVFEVVVAEVWRGRLSLAITVKCSES